MLKFILSQIPPDALNNLELYWQEQEQKHNGKIQILVQRQENDEIGVSITVRNSTGIRFIEPYRRASLVDVLNELSKSVGPLGRLLGSFSSQVENVFFKLENTYPELKIAIERREKITVFILSYTGVVRSITLEELLSMLADGDLK
ncbi:MAG: hypothetical protein KatS3mg101_1172 [Patescibacteria group bacterium]|nr:MAG: hypothetical protein KatS3mg101_1172 [Patescibacteria group bacterium]